MSAADGKAILTADGKRAVMANGKIAIDEACCPCTPTPYDCCQCGQYCFSSISTALVTWDVTIDGVRYQGHETATYEGCGLWQGTVVNEVYNDCGQYNLWTVILNLGGQAPGTPSPGVAGTVRGWTNTDWIIPGSPSVVTGTATVVIQNNRCCKSTCYVCNPGGGPDCCFAADTSATIVWDIPAQNGNPASSGTATLTIFTDNTPTDVHWMDDGDQFVRLNCNYGYSFAFDDPVYGYTGTFAEGLLLEGDCEGGANQAIVLHDGHGNEITADITVSINGNIGGCRPGIPADDGTCNPLPG